MKILIVKLFAFIFSLTGNNFIKRFLNLIKLSTDRVSASPGIIIKNTTYISTPRGEMTFVGLGPLPEWRAETLLSKEPETIEWINSMEDGDVFYDIGANIGVFSVYAAINRKISVLSFEPLPSNYYLLNLNLERNNLAEVAQAYCLAMSDQDNLGRFYAQDTEFGSALSSYGQPIEQYGQTHASDFEQGMLGMTLNTFTRTYQPRFPTHLKIDVDGNEDKIILGASEILSDTRLKSISIELNESNPEYVERVSQTINNAGFKLASKRRSAIFDGTPSSTTFNFLFRR